MKIFLIIIALLGTLIPTVFTIQEAGGVENWQGVLPRGQVDSLYYYARIKEVTDGYPLIGNPYLFEYRETLTPGFFLPDIISALPMLVGVPFNIGVIINMFVWSSVFLFLAYILLRLLKLPQWWAFSGSTLMYTMAFAYIIRPTALQLMYPLFLAFLIVFIKFLYNSHSRRNQFYLAAISALSFYMYTLLTYIIFVSLGIITLWYLCSRRFKEFRSIVISGLITTLLSIPYFVYSYIQLGFPNFTDTWLRMGMVYTYVPAIEVYYYGRWIAMGLVAILLLQYFYPKKRGGDAERCVFWIATGVSLFTGFSLNVLTGVDVALAVHTGRFFFVWMTMITAVIAFEWFTTEFKKKNIVGDKNSLLRYARICSKYFVLVIIILLFIGIMRNTPPGPSFFNFNKHDTFEEMQEYGAPLNWLEKNIEHQTVIWANDSISAHIPIMTKHYVLFHENATFQIASNIDIENRYLLSRSLYDYSVDDLKREYVFYAGIGAELDAYSKNLFVQYCNIAIKIKEKITCPDHTDAVSIRGEEYFQDLNRRYLVSKDFREIILNTYNVEYFILDTLHDEISSLSTTTAVYDDGRFVILPLPFELK